MSRKIGFTLIELLVVIAIIAILAAIIFPVFMRTKESAYRSGDMTNMNSIRNALQLYRADQEGFPPQILGYATVYSSGPQMGQIIPAENLRAALYPKRIDSLNTLRPAYDRLATNVIVSAAWPNADPRALGTAPVKDLDGNGIIDANDDFAQARQAYGPSLYFCSPPTACDAPFAASNGTTTLAGGKAAPFYAVSGYDVSQVRIPPAGPPDLNRWELRYTLRWSSYAMGGGNRNDDPRQLIYSEPPDDTVITWDSWFREYTGNALPTHDKKDFVLFLGGQARTYDSANLNDRSWRVLP